MGRCVIGMNGIKITGEQISLLSCLGIKKMGILFDRGAEKEQDNLISICSAFIPEVFSFEELWDDYDDPGSLTQKQVSEIRNVFFGS